MNEKLLNYYLDRPRLTEGQIKELKSYKCDIPFEILNSVLPGSWTYEILSEDINNITYHVTIALYVPGNVMTAAGFSTLDINTNYKEKAILLALKNALKYLTLTELKEEMQKEQVKSSNEFTKEQRNALGQFVKDYEILNDDMLLRYLKVWNKNITSKSELNSSNVDSFLNMIKNIKKLD